MSRVMTRMADLGAAGRRREKVDAKRRRAGLPHRIEYFHQVKDGYSHLAAQLLVPLLEAYDVELVCHLVTVAHDGNLPEPELLLRLSRDDAAAVAPHYGLRFASGRDAPPDGLVEQAEAILAQVDGADFPKVAVAVGDALWAGDADALKGLADRHGCADAETTRTCIERGVARRRALGHYSAAMFHYGGEWYWGADRLYHLEQRFAELGVARAVGAEPICPRPGIEYGPLRDDGSLTFEVYPSLRSPYTSFIFDLAVKLATETGVRLVVRPVLPMVMRGVPVTRTKGSYIMWDASREAAALGLSWGKIYDPIGDPVRRAYSLYPWACEQGRGNELLSEFLRAAFTDGINTNNDRGLRHVVERSGLSFDEAKAIVGNPHWEAELEDNRLAMYEFGTWGVPTFRLLDDRGTEVLALWGQDRLWLFAREIQRLLRERASAGD